jgi:hypothetical protein
MQKDFHYNVTLALALAAGCELQTAMRIAWADQFTDELTGPARYETQTQSKVLGNWGQRTVQEKVLIPFHFVPGDDRAWPWMVTRNSQRVRKLMAGAARSGDPMRLGIALHALQDSYSHEGFSGWDEPRNGTYLFWYIANPTPNVGHADFKCAPDLVCERWTDSRTGRRIDNRRRAMACAKNTYRWLLMYAERPDDHVWPDVATELKATFANKSYDGRKRGLARLTGILHETASADYFRFSKITKAYESKYRTAFVQAARAHAGLAMQLCADLPAAP